MKNVFSEFYDKQGTPIFDGDTLFDGEKDFVYSYEKASKKTAKDLDSYREYLKTKCLSFATNFSVDDVFVVVLLNVSDYHVDFGGILGVHQQFKYAMKCADKYEDSKGYTPYIFKTEFPLPF